jgi:ATP-dependent RNA helicase RhlB
VISLPDIEAYIGRKIPVAPVPQDMLPEIVAPAPVRHRHGHGGRGRPHDNGHRGGGRRGPRREAGPRRDGGPRPARPPRPERPATASSTPPQNADKAPAGEGPKRRRRRRRGGRRGEGGAPTNPEATGD